MNGYIVLQLIVVVLCFYMSYCDAATLGNACDTSADPCKGANVVCNTNGVDTTGTCKCTNAGYVVNTNTNTDCTAVKQLGGEGCVSGQSNTCVGSNIQCTGGTCECVTGFYDDNGSSNPGGTCAQKVGLGYLCPMADACYTNNAVCDGGTCKCGADYYDDNTDTTIGGNCRTRKSIGSPCAHHSPIVNDQCSDSNALCSGGTPGSCNCNPGYFLDGSTNTCKPKVGLGYNCPQSDACATQDAVCDNNQNCVCSSGYYDSNGTNLGGTCVSKVNVGSQCATTDACSDGNAECKSPGSSVCTCRTGFVLSSSSCVTDHCINNQCQNGGTCVNRVSDYTCNCLTGIAGNNCETKASLGAVCPQQSILPNSCTDINAECMSNRCQCKFGYYDTNGVNFGGGTCLPKVTLGNSGCSIASGVTDSCSDTNAECGSSNVCQCKSAYYDDNGSQQEGACQLKKDLGDTCDTVNQCSDSNTICSTTCQCASSHYDDTSGFGGSCVQKNVVGANCPRHLGLTASCSDTNAECSSSTCQCKATFYDDNGGIAGGLCVSKKEVGDNCPGSLASTASCSDTNAECSKVGITSTYTCQCRSTHYDDNGGNGGGPCVSKITLGDDCPSNLGPTASCSDTYGECSVVGQTSNYKCQCKSTHYDNNGDTWGGTCIIRKTIQNSCDYYFPSENDQCSDPNALCTGGNPGACTCNTGYHQEGSICEPNKALGESCDPNVSGECSDPYALCLNNPTAKLCTCRTGYYKYNNNGVYICSPVSQLQVTNMQFTSVTTSRFTVSWSAPAGKSAYIAKYTVEWRPIGNSVAGSSVDTPTTSTTVSTGLTSGQAYTVTITSVNTGTQSGSERYTSASKEQALVPLKPGLFDSGSSDLTVSSSNGITVRWAASAGIVRQYVFVMKDGDTEKRTLYPASSVAQPSFNGMKNGYTYNIEITALSQLYDDGKDLSSETYSFTLKTTVQIPTSPVNIECTASNIYDSHILLTWGEPTYPNGDIIQYFVEVFVRGESTAQQTYNTNSNDTSYDVLNLNPGSLYTFKVKTQNELYTSGAGTLNQQYCTTRAKMADVPENLLTKDITSRGMKTEWDKPINVYSAENLGYVLQIKAGTNCAIEQIYRCSDCTQTFQLNDLTGLCASNRLAEIPHTKEELNAQLLFTTSGLDPDTPYSVFVTAINNAGRGNPAIVTQTTLEEAPQMPTNVMTNAVTSTTVEVRWSIEGPRPGVTTYTIMVEPVDTAAPSVTSTVQGFTNTSYKVTGLEEFWTYTVKVKVATSKGTKTSDTSSEFKTLAAAPGPVDAFTIKTPDEDYTLLKINWKTPTVLQRNGVINSFKFTHNATELTGLTADLGIPETFIAENLDSTVYEKTVIVQPEDIYMFQVYAVNDDDQQGYVTSKIKMAPAGVPQTPMNVVTSDISSTSVVVSWNIEGPRPGITIYTVMVNPVNTAASAVIQQVYGFGNTSCTVIGLEEFWEYTAKVKMETPVGEETSDVTLVFKTMSAPPGPVDALTFNGPFNGDITQMQISWKMPTILHRNGVIKDLKIVHNATSRSNIESEESSTFSARQEDFIYSIIVDVIPKRTYSVQVYAINTEDMTGEITKETIVASSPETETQESSNTSLIIAAVLGGVVLLMGVALVIFIVRYKRLKTKHNGRHHSKSLANTEENASFDNLQEASIPVSGDYANNYMELDDTSRVDTYDKIAIGRPDVDSSATDTEQYEIPDVPTQNRWK